MRSYPKRAEDVEIETTIIKWINNQADSQVVGCRYIIQSQERVPSSGASQNQFSRTTLFYIMSQARYPVAFTTFGPAGSNIGDTKKSTM